MHYCRFVEYDLSKTLEPSKICFGQGHDYLMTTAATFVNSCTHKMSLCIRMNALYDAIFYFHVNTRQSSQRAIIEDISFQNLHYNNIKRQFRDTTLSSTFSLCAICRLLVTTQSFDHILIHQTWWMIFENNPYATSLKDCYVLHNLTRLSYSFDFIILTQLITIRYIAR